MENTKELMLSMVVPVYNQEKYLRECLDSLLHQDVAPETYEIICVNDGSTDSSLQILEEYAEQFSNIRIIDKTNGGVSSARNAGIDAAQGKYLWFIDSDDYIKENFLGHLFNLIRQYDPDSVFVLPCWDVKELQYTEFKYTDICGLPFYSRGPTKNIKKLSQVKHLRFDESMKYAEDSYYEGEFYILPSHGVHIRIWDKIYYYRPNEQGACQSLDLGKKVEDSLKTAEFFKQAIKEKELESEQIETLTRHMRHLVWSAMWFLPRTTLAYQTTMKRIKSSGLKLPFLWALPVTEKELKWRIKKFVSRFFHCGPIYWLFFKIVRARYKRQFK